jgi:hypothetical protein
VVNIYPDFLSMTFQQRTGKADQLDQSIVHGTVIQHRTLAPVDDQTHGAKQPQLMADRRLGYIEQRGQIADTHFLLQQGMQNPQSARLAKGLNS